MGKVSGALRDTVSGAEYTLAQVLKILVHCSDFHKLTNEMKSGASVVTLSKTDNKNNLGNLKLATLFGSIIGNNKNDPETSLGLGDPNSNEFNGQKMFTAWELARIIAKTADKAITTANAVKVLNCLQDDYRKLDIVFYELANCRVDGAGNYDFAHKNGPKATDDKRGELLREVCFALAQNCHKAKSNNDLTNYKDANTGKIFVDGEGGYDNGYLSGKNRYEKLWLNNGAGATKKSNEFPIKKLGNGNKTGNVKTDLYAIIVAVCNKKIGTGVGEIDFGKDNWDGNKA